ncbi:hypothetical protein PS467_10820 [Streptomyces luomodiensis]|uniref:Uncharacterized protein n=1 Tax=Streptomyces luomodiensis TaxID=3026192 RepID=A0ABY9UTD8_9ACTN|nr:MULTISPECIES: hypothetical protein [unclassified Streptomyces]WAP55268.1 hypothetical protein N6H00_09920 [Streptomyces sp. S465]WNE95787.1 hypothetical protein PS467_10820 [Streptomyces sp. SCA4-21]
MSARTRTRPVHPADSGVDVRLPWWALALPVLAFVALLLLLTGPTDAHAASGGSGPVSQTVELLHRAFGRAAL